MALQGAWKTKQIQALEEHSELVQIPALKSKDLTTTVPDYINKLFLGLRHFVRMIALSIVLRYLAFPTSKL